MTTAQINKLVKQAQAGDKLALEKLYNHFFNQIYFYVYSRINDQHKTQDIVSEIFLSMVEGIHKFKGQSSFKNYIFGITKNKMRDYIRNKYKTADYIPQSSLPEESFDNIAQAEEEDKTYRIKIRTILKSIYSSMKPRYAKVLDLRFNKMNSVEETAQILGISSNNVKVIQHRAIKQAKTIWDKMHVNMQ
jgi:RNA polymerase sigma factor (sigma-70 family)